MFTAEQGTDYSLHLTFRLLSTAAVLKDIATTQTPVRLLQRTIRAMTNDKHMHVHMHIITLPCNIMILSLIHI